MDHSELVRLIEPLYALRPAEFTAERNRVAKEVRSGDADAARDIASLRKPSASAWLVNTLVGERAGDVDALLGIGETLRDAQRRLAREELTAGAAARRRAIVDLRQAAVGIANDAGQPATNAVLDEVGQTLLAATVDPRAGGVVRSARLVRALAVEGEEVDVEGALAGPETEELHAAVASDAPAVDASAEEADRRRRADAARVRVEEAAASVDAIEERIARMRQEAAGLREEADELEARIREVGSAVGKAERELRSLEREREKAETELTRARRSASHLGDDAV
jgi:hypothetical protein